MSHPEAATAEPIMVTAPDGRSLEVLTGGDPDGFPLLYHSGTPTAAVHDPQVFDAAAGQGLRLVTYSRPGYGASSPWHERAMIADDAQDSAVVLHHFGIEEFLTLGWSGGGPRALACAALLSAGCRAATTLAGVAPIDADGLEFTAGMGPENVEDFAAAREGVEAYEAYLERELPGLFSAAPEDLVEAMGGLLTPVDAAYLTDEAGIQLSRSFGHAGAQGVRGARDDGLALVAPWGFDVSAIHVPVAVWQGRQDAMVPYAHGVWLAANIPSARPHLFDDEGHLSLAARLPEMFAELRQLADL